jgi:hypothetical protein
VAAPEVYLREFACHGSGSPRERFIDLTQASFDGLVVPGNAPVQVRRREDLSDAQLGHASDGREHILEVIGAVVDAGHEVTVNVGEGS